MCCSACHASNPPVHASQRPTATLLSNMPDDEVRHFESSKSPGGAAVCQQEGIAYLRSEMPRPADAVFLCIALLVCALPRSRSVTTFQMRDVRMQLYLTNESIPAEDQPLSDTPLVQDPLIEGNPLPPQTLLRPLTPTELLIRPTHEYVAVCLITSDQGEDVREWINHYLRLGVGRFYIFDHSHTSIVAAFADLVYLGVVEYEPVPVSCLCT